MHYPLSHLCSSRGIQDPPPHHLPPTLCQSLLQLHRQRQPLPQPARIHTLLPIAPQITALVNQALINSLHINCNAVTMLTPARGRDSEPTASFAVACAPEHRATLPLPLHMASLQTLCACASGAAQTFILARVCMRMNTSHARNLCKSARAPP